MLQVLPRLAECGLLLAAGAQLRASGIFTLEDGTSALRLASYTTLPAAVLQSLVGRPPLTAPQWAGAATAQHCHFRFTNPPPSMSAILHYLHATSTKLSQWQARRSTCITARQRCLIN